MYSVAGASRPNYLPTIHFEASTGPSVKQWSMARVSLSVLQPQNRQTDLDENFYPELTEIQPNKRLSII